MGHDAAPELIPVKASVFDDDFFRPTPARDKVDFNGMEGGLRDGCQISGSGRAKDEEVHILTEDVFPVEAALRVPFGGSTVAAADPAQPDELDIPAFLRRGNG
jgi:cell division protein FtsZ